MTSLVGGEGGGLSPDLPRALADLAPRVTVVGDLILDGWWTGRTERVSREAPAPVVEVTARRYAPGGAGNTAVNLAAMGARVRLVGVAGDDEPGRTLLGLLTKAGVDVDGVVLQTGTSTVTKTRIVSGEQILLRIDDVHRPAPAERPRAELAARLEVALTDADAVVVCDYGAEVLLEPVRDTLAARAAADRERPLVVVDAHDPSPWAGLRPDLVTPNAAEAFGLLGRPAPLTGRVAAVTAAAGELRARTGADTVVVTLDRDGTVALGPDGPRARTVAQPGSEQQASGAGDTFVAALTLARVAGLGWPTAMELAQAAADVVVARFGTSVCSTDDLADHLGRAAARVLTAVDLVDRVRADRAAGRRVVLTNGCFDVLHRGHTSSLAEAARLGDVLVVAVNSDASVRRLKGPDRPVNTEADRAAVLAALSCVTYVTVFDTDTPIPLIERLRPDVYAKGGDYTPQMLTETAAVEACGGEVRILGYLPAQSTTELVGRIRAGRAEPGNP